MCCVIWYHLYNRKKLKNTHGGVFKTSFKLLHGWFSRLLNCRNGTKSRKTSPSLDLWEVSKYVFSQSLLKSKKYIFEEDLPPLRWGKKWNLMTSSSDPVKSRFRISYWFFVTRLETLKTRPKCLHHFIIFTIFGRLKTLWLKTKVWASFVKTDRKQFYKI